jgi:hypothetical protein
MDQLLAKLTALSYELFGVIVPGIVAEILLALWWAALGPLAPRWTNEALPELTVNTAGTLINSLNIATGFGIGVPLFVFSYFLGHLLVWIGRSGKPLTVKQGTGTRILGKSLCFRIPKPATSFDPALNRLYDAGKQKFSAGRQEEYLTWQEFYPVARSYLLQNTSYSLVVTYQNKYTLHRSVATASALWFWLGLIGIVGGAFTVHCYGGASPYWGWLVTLTLVALVLVWGFSNGYLFHWQNFGNSIVTETYSLLYGPKDSKAHEK